MSDRIAALERAISAVRGRISGAARRAGRDPEEVRLIAVTKDVPAERVALAAEAGVRDFGENYVQELVRKRDRVPDATWHFVGRLQRNKARRVLEAADLVHSLEPGRATSRLSALAAERGRPAAGLVEVDFTDFRVGVAPEAAEAFVEELERGGGIRVLGLMTIAPADQDPRPAFSMLRELRDRIRQRFERVAELSMGMSADLEVAVEEGATMVRVGTAIFGPRRRPASAAGGARR